MADVVAFLIIYYFLIGIFQLQWILSDTYTTGGDMGSHQFPAMFMRNHLLPNLEITGWSMDWYAGFPIFEFYFPLPFMAIALLSYVISFQVAFKLITVLGVFMMPLVSYISMRLMGFRFPMPVIAAAFSLTMLFNEEYSMWGGNVKSTLAGEFTFTIGFALVVLFLGLAYAHTESGKRFKSASLVLASIPLCHVYTLLWGVASSIYLLFSRRKDVLRRNFNRMSGVYLMGFLLSAFWTLKLLTKFQWATPFGAWRTQSLMEVVPSILFPYYFLGGIALLMFFLNRERNLGFLVFMTATGVGFFLVIHSGITEHLLDVRFMPFAYLGLLYMSAYPLAKAALRFKAPWIVALVIVLLSIIWVGSNRQIMSVTNALLKGADVTKMDDYQKLMKNVMEFRYDGDVPSWVKWNYEGFENKNKWDGLKEFFDFLGTLPKGRVVHEFSSSHESFGTPRTLELIPFFSNQPVLEGLNIESSVSSPYHFYMQSEYSPTATCPLSYMRCTTFNLSNAVKHFRYFAPTYFVTASPKLKVVVDELGGFTLLRAFKYDLAVYKVDDPAPIVEVPQYMPVVVETKDWKTVSLKWWKNLDAIDVPLVFEAKASDYDKRVFKQVIPEGRLDIDNLPRQPTASNCRVNYQVFDEKVEADTSCPGAPHLVKISYNPGWKVDGADRIYLVSPSFMLVIPTTKHFTLYYSLTAFDTFALALSYLGAAVLVFVAVSDDPRLKGFAFALSAKKKTDAIVKHVERLEDRLFGWVLAVVDFWPKAMIFMIVAFAVVYVVTYVSDRNTACDSVCGRAGFAGGSASFPYIPGSSDYFDTGYDHPTENLEHRLDCRSVCDSARGDFFYVSMGTVKFTMKSAPGIPHKLSLRVDDSGPCRTTDVKLNGKYVASVKSGEDPIGWTLKEVIIPSEYVTSKTATIELSHNSTECLGFDVSDVWLEGLNCAC